MMNQLVAFAEAQAMDAARRGAATAAFALAGGLFALFGVAGLFAALFFWIEPELGPIPAALICATIAMLLAIAALLPLAFKRRPAPNRHPNGRCRSSCHSWRRMRRASLQGN